MSVSFGGWLKGKANLVERAVKLGCVRSKGVNLINVQSRCSTKVTVAELEGCGDVFTVECDGVKVSGVVLGDTPLLSRVAGQTVGLVELSGCVIIAKGTTCADIIQQVTNITEVYNSY